MVSREVETDVWHLVVAGWVQGRHGQELRRLCADLGLARTVHFVGPQFGLSKAASFRRADAFILPSFSEGLPLAVLEAWSYALPVVMTRECNLPEGFETGAAIPVEVTTRSIAEGLRRLFRMADGERRAMGYRGRHLVARRHDWSVIAARMSSVYEWLLGGLVPANVEIHT